jgi:hypothetical protein
MRSFIILAGLAISLAACQPPANVKDQLETSPLADKAQARQNSLLPQDIMLKAHAAAGGSQWLRPESLYMDGYGIFYRDGKATTHESHKMWRVYDSAKTDAHKVDGKVRIRSISGGVPIFDLSYDGVRSYTPDGPLPAAESDKRWSSNFGFGVIRHAFDPGYSLARLPDDLIDARPAYMIKVVDPMGGTTIFGIAQNDYAVLKVGFETPRGWHERIYSNFFTNSGVSWVQPGRVRLYYNGVKANEIIWTSFEIDSPLPDCLFVLPETDDCRG